MAPPIAVACATAIHVRSAVQSDDRAGDVMMLARSAARYATISASSASVGTRRSSVEPAIVASAWSSSTPRPPAYCATDCRSASDPGNAFGCRYSSLGARRRVDRTQRRRQRLSLLPIAKVETVTNQVDDAGL